MVSNYGKGKIFVDLTNGGIGSLDQYDNLRVVRNALIWLKDLTLEIFQIVIEGIDQPINITTLSNSIISSFDFEKEQKTISFYITGLLGTLGYCNITIPKRLMWCEELRNWAVTVDIGSPKSLFMSENASCTCLDFTYDHSTYEIKITSQYAIPEFPLFLILPLFMIATLPAVIVYRKKHTDIVQRIVPY